MLALELELLCFYFLIGHIGDCELFSSNQFCRDKTMYVFTVSFVMALYALI